MASSLPLPSQSHTASEPVQLLVLPTNDTYIEIYKECSIGLSSFAVSSKHPANHSFDCVDPWLVPWVAPCGLAALSNCLFEILLCLRSCCALLCCPVPSLTLLGWTLATCLLPSSPLSISGGRSQFLPGTTWVSQAQALPAANLTPGKTGCSGH